MDIDGNVSTAKMNYIKNNVNYIIIDEISMITKELWKRLTFVKLSTGVKFLLLGDDKQLPPVEDEKIKHYFNHSAVHYLSNNNRNILSIKKRYNPDLANVLNDVKNVNIKMFPFKETPINMSYTHKTRIEVNKKWNDKLKPSDALFIPVRENDEKRGQDMYIYTGCPLIARHKYQGTTITEPFTIWEWNHPCMSKKAKYTALSRGTCPENISIVGNFHEED